MELIDQSHKIWGISPSTYDEAMLWVERAARTCYASTDKIKPGSAEKLINSIMSNDPPHSSVLEHVSIYAIWEGRQSRLHEDLMRERLNSRWLTRIPNIGLDGLEVFGNLRAWMERLNLNHPKKVYQWLSNSSFKLLSSDVVPEYAKRITVELTTDRAILAELSRHRDDVGLSVESQRYVNYDDGITFIKPSWYQGLESTLVGAEFWESCAECERDYQKLRSSGLSPQHARTVLNSQVKTTIVMSAYLPEWKWIFKLRTGAGAYPQMIKLIRGVETEITSAAYYRI